MATPMELEEDLAAVTKTLATLIVWIAQSAGSPISVKHAEQLLAMLPPDRDKAG
jgi:hypothetical protein